MKNKFGKLIVGYFFSAVAGVLNAISIFTFVNPNKFVPGGFSGVSTTLAHLLSGALPISFETTMSLLYFVINLPLLICSVIMLRGDFTVKTIISTVVCSVALGLFPPEFVFTDSPLISAVFGGLIMGLAMYVAAIYNGSNGGTEVIAKMVNKYHSEVDLSKIILIANVIIMSVGSILLICIQGVELWIVLYSVIYVFVGSEFMGMLNRGFDHPQKYIIVTEKCDEISQVLINKFKRGFSVFDVEDNPRKKMIMVVIQNRQAPALKRIVESCDSEAFTFVKEVYDVFSRPLFNRSYLK